MVRLKNALITRIAIDYSNYDRYAAYVGDFCRHKYQTAAYLKEMPEPTEEEYLLMRGDVIDDESLPEAVREEASRKAHEVLYRRVALMNRLRVASIGALCPDSIDLD